MNKKNLLNVLLYAIVFFSFTSIIHAADTPIPTPVSFVGEITPPDAWKSWLKASDVAGGPIVLFANLILRLVLIGAGFFAIWKFILAGFSFMNAGGDVAKLDEARNHIVYTILGLLVIASALVLAGIVGVLFYGQWDAIISPEITGAPILGA